MEHHRASLSAAVLHHTAVPTDSGVTALPILG